MSSTRWLIGTVSVIAIVIAAAVLVALLGGGERRFAAGTPERAVQEYLQAIARRDATSALDYLAPDVRDACGGSPREAILNRGANGLRATLEETTLRADGTALVRVRIAQTFGDSPFGGSELITSPSFELRHVDGEWRFAEAPWPLACPRLIPATPPPPVPSSRLPAAPGDGRRAGT